MKRIRKVPPPAGRAMVRGLSCPECGSVFDRDKSHYDYTLSRGGTVYCSASCATKVNARNREGMTEEKFWSKVDKTPGQGSNGDCWIWTGPKDFNGYGSVGWKSFNKLKRSKTHRVAYQLLIGSIPEGLYLCHSCDNPPCCNPAHLSPGTQGDNMGDAVAKGRMPKGERSYAARHTDAQIREMKLWLLLGYCAEYLSPKFNMRPADIRKISRGLMWKHITVTESDLNARPELEAQAELDKAEGKKTYFIRPMRPSIGPKGRT